MKLYPHQRAAINALAAAGAGRHLVVMATGTGKTVMLATALRELHPGRPALWIAHRHELIEQAKRTVAPCVHCETEQTVARHPERYQHYDILVVDEAHHAAARTYRLITDALQPTYLYGLTATPNRGDGVGMSDVFDNIVYEYNLLQAVADGKLARPIVRQVRTELSLDGLSNRAGDFVKTELEALLNTPARNNLIARLVTESPKPCMIFAVDVAHAHALASVVEGAVAVDGKTPTKRRQEIYDGFLSGAIPVLTNCELYTEGADFPNMRTVVMARPTQSQTLYIQMAGRVLRWLPDKTEGLIVDIVDGSYKHAAYQAPCLIGLDPVTDAVYERHPGLNGDLINDIPAQVEAAYNSLEAIIKSDQILRDWARRVHLDQRDIAFTRHPDGSLLLSLPDGSVRRLPPLKLNEPISVMQKRVDEVYQELLTRYMDKRIIWDRRAMRAWARDKATPAQMNLIYRLRPAWAKKPLTKAEASRVLNVLLGGRKR